LGRQAQARNIAKAIQQVKEAPCSLEVTARGEPPSVMLARPEKHLLPANLGRTCGRREREADAGSSGEQSSFAPVVAAVEGILVHQAPASFAGGRKNVGLGRSGIVRSRSLPLRAALPATAGALWSSEEGNVVGVRKAHALDTEDAKKARSSLFEDTSLLGPETRARLSSLDFRPQGMKVARRFDIAVG